MNSSTPGTPVQTPSEASHPENSGWWQTYVIRYFVGTVVGGAILLFLNASPLSALQGNVLPGITDLKSLDSGILIVIGAVGLAYCYLASAPVLVLHASRASFLGDTKILNWMLGSAAAVVVITLTIGFFWSAFDRKFLFSAGIMTLVLLLQIIPMIFSMRHRGKCSHEYYEKLSQARADRKSERQEYKESYRHLREHGNAFFILLFEGTLGVVLAGLPDPGVASIFLLIWIVPATFVWFLGTRLEARYAGI